MGSSLLLVDDSAMDRTLIRDVLGAENRGYDLHEAGCVADGLAALASRSFDLVIIDHHLPDGTGLDVLRGLQSREHEIPAIYLTSELSREVIQSALSLGASHYLTKDLAYANLLAPVVARSLELDRVRRERARAVDQLAQAEAHASIRSDFLAKVTHELRTPISSILGYTDCLLEGFDGALNERQTGSLERVRRNARRLLGFINELLDFSALEARQMACEPAVFPLAPLLDELACTVRERIRPGVDLNLACAQTLTVRCDRALLARAVGHLLDNAARFTIEGEVRVEVHADATSGGAVCIAVTDTGPGIPAERLASVREPFRQGDEGLSRMHEGAGLGLAVVERLARLMRGELEVESAPGTGSTFRLVLPVLHDDAPGSWPPSPATVLAVDRDSDAHALAAKILARGGIRVTGVLSVAFALALLPEMRPSAILLDLATARGEDADLISRFREEARRRGVPVLAVRLNGDRPTAPERDAAFTLEKPFNPDTLLAQVRALLAAMAGER
jgi:signal transduction histidine kinase